MLPAALAACPRATGLVRRSAAAGGALELELELESDDDRAAAVRATGRSPKSPGAGFPRMYRGF